MSSIKSTIKWMADITRDPAGTLGIKVDTDMQKDLAVLGGAAQKFTPAPGGAKALPGALPQSSKLTAEEELLKRGFTPSKDPEFNKKTLARILKGDITPALAKEMLVFHNNPDEYHQAQLKKILGDEAAKGNWFAIWELYKGWIIFGGIVIAIVILLPLFLSLLAALGIGNHE